MHVALNRIVHLLWAMVPGVPCNIEWQRLPDNVFRIFPLKKTSAVELFKSLSIEAQLSNEKITRLTFSDGWESGITLKAFKKCIIKTFGDYLIPEQHEVETAPEPEIVTPEPVKSVGRPRKYAKAEA